MSGLGGDIVRLKFLFGLLFIFATLKLEELIVNTPTMSELRRRADFINFTATKRNDFINVLNSAETMGNDDGGTAFHKSLQGFLNHGFGFAVKAAGGFVKNKNWRVFEKCSSNGNTLLLSS